MSEEEEKSDPGNMALSWEARTLQPLSLGVLWVLEWVESDKVYFDEIEIELRVWVRTTANRRSQYVTMVLALGWTAMSVALVL